MLNVTYKEEPITLSGEQLSVGDPAPEFTVLDNKMNPVTLSDFEGKIKLISVVPSIDTGVCDSQTRRFNEDANRLDNVKVLTISMDLPFAQKRWGGNSGINNVITLSDHKDASFGRAYGVLIEEMRLLTRAIFVVDTEDELYYVEYVEEATKHPDYEKAIQTAESLSEERGS
ncbi:thiol peroxidase [Halobacillus salinarum]|uniref:Thiol peroxidase n=1 Tax=Halobacillus salinarum TaxID=2932257 RepID=A0ABY4EQ84_9BACI|nr:thiol peroxidase [Halobacillus salinarum]UOQ46145.1 thiol peroxidase [Halobacillus salinarum]